MKRILHNLWRWLRAKLTGKNLTRESQDEYCNKYGVW